MRMNDRRMTNKRKVLIALLIITLLFIWGNSLLSKEYSGSESMRIVVFLERFFGEGNVSEHFIRKLAHFTEFAVLGAELFGLFRRYPLSVTHGLFAAIIDESLQMFSDRSAEVKDVLLDFTGVLFGALVVLLIIRICYHRSKEID